MRIISGDQKLSRLQWLQNQYRSRLVPEGKFACTWDKAVELDPTPNKKYLDWVLRLIVQEKLPAEDHYKVPAALGEFIRCQSMLKRDGHRSDINDYDGLSDLFRVLQPYEMKSTSAELSRAERALVDAQTEVILDSDELLVISPKTKKASCFWGRGTKWCTAATGSGTENAFSQYTDADGSGLYIFIDKKNSGVKYQLSKSGDLADELDHTHEFSNEHIDRLFFLSKGIHEDLDLAFVSFDAKFLASLNQTDDFCQKALLLNIKALKFITNQTPSLVQTALSHSPDALQFIRDQTKEVCFKAVEEDGLALKFVDFGPKMQWENREIHDLCEQAIVNNALSIHYCPHQTEDLCLLAVRLQAKSLQYIREPSEAVCIEAVKRYPEALSWAPKQTTKICTEAVRRWPTALNYVRKHAPEIDLAAVCANPVAITLIPEERQTIELCEQAIKKRPDLVHYLKKPTAALLNLASELRASHEHSQHSQHNSSPATNFFRMQSGL